MYVAIRHPEGSAAIYMGTDSTATSLEDFATSITEAGNDSGAQIHEADWSSEKAAGHSLPLPGDDDEPVMWTGQDGDIAIYAV